MKKIFIFLILIIFVFSQPSEERKEEMRKRREEAGKKRKEHDLVVANCIINSEEASPEFKKYVEENKDELMKALHPSKHPLEKKDRDIFRKCRKEIFEKIREERKKEIYE